MTVMAATAGSTPVDRSEPFTVRDLEGMPDDGRRYELIDGTLIVSPTPSLPHQRIVYRLHAALDADCPGHFEVVGAPFGVRTSESTEIQPDVLVARQSDLTDERLPAAPVLAVEVLSPSSKLYDLNSKKAAYERMGTPSYWVIDPTIPKLTVFELDEQGCYQRIAEVSGDKEYEATRPFPVTIVPAELSRRRDA